jgi:acetolactate synthase-1/2/3 large subunit
MTGADRLCDVLLANGIDVCFANPGTSEMHFVAALDRRPEMRCILGLFEGVVSGAADGYARMTRKPAATLLHTGPGLAYGLANQHNARKAGTPMVSIVGDHASYHLKRDPPLASDIESLARPMSEWVRRITGPDDVAPATQAAIEAAITMRGVATLILPADASWSEAHSPASATTAKPSHRSVDDETIHAVAAELRAKGSRAGILVGQDAAIGDAFDDAARAAAATGARLLNETLVARTDRGRGRPLSTRIPYRQDEARAVLAGLDLLVIVGSREPVGFFAYPGKPARLVPDDCSIVTLAGRTDDQAGALARLVKVLGADDTLVPRGQGSPAIPSMIGKLTGDAISEALAFHLPERAIVICESIPLATGFEQMAVAAEPHDFIFCTVGGAIGAGIPAATGAAIASPDHKVICVQPDGSGMFTLQGLWTQARENLDVLTIVLSNRAYGILKFEMLYLGLGEPQANARRMMEIDHPPLDWVALAKGHGVEGARAETAQQFRDVLTAALKRRGPFLIEAMI